MKAADARLYWLWLQLALPPGSRAAGLLLDRLGDARRIHEADEAALRQAEIPEADLTRLLKKDLEPASQALQKALEIPESWN